MIVLSSHAEVLARLRAADAPGAVSTQSLREAARSLFCAEKLDVWTARWEVRWRERLTSVPVSGYDLMGGVAHPVSVSIAADVCGLTEPQAAEWVPSAWLLADAEANPGGARHATLALMERLQSPLLVQAFAALVSTFPAFIGNAWHQLLQHPDQMERLVAEPERLSDAVEELLRLAGPAEAVFRCDAAGERVKLLLADANRDPAAFPNPDRFQFDRHSSPHVALGAGPHACAGSALIRLAARAPIVLFAARYAGKNARFAVEAAEGASAFRALRSLTPMLP